MAIILVEHRTPEPALYGAMASIVAHMRGAQAAHLPATFDTIRLSDAVQHVTADGYLVPSGLIWFERVAGLSMSRETSINQVVRQAKDNDVIVPVAPVDDVHEMYGTKLLSLANAAGIVIERMEATSHKGQYTLVDLQSRAFGESPIIWRRDQFGRLERATDFRNRSVSSPPLRIALVGTESDHRNIYPSALAALGDAADSIGSALDVFFVPPIGLSEQDAEQIINRADGILLPGGSDMANVSGQILMARVALQSRIPTLGLCLGMQTMTTAVAQQTPNLSGANLAEVDPSAPVKTFIPISDGSPTVHRLGEEQIFVRPGSHLYSLLGPTDTIRCNHRYKLNPVLIGELSQVGLAVTAHDRSGTIAEGVELKEHPFFIGMQGHPELKSRRNFPHPLIRAFLGAADSHKTKACMR